MPRIEKVFLSFSHLYPHVFFIREGQTEASQWRGYYPTKAQLARFVERIQSLAFRGKVEIKAHDFGWIAQRINGRQGETTP